MFSGKKILITAGPTYEPIDPVRFLGNRSSGKMGFAIAAEFYAAGGEVVLVKGPTNVTFDVDGVRVIEVETAQEMYEACMKEYADSDIIIMAAAVADYTPTEIMRNKRKKGEGNWTLELKRTKDILAEVGKLKSDEQVLVGFALETENELENAENKLRKKNADMIVLNSLKNEGAGFRHDTNQVTILDKLGNINKFGLKAKSQVAKDILKTIEDYVSMPKDH